MNSSCWPFALPTAATPIGGRGTEPWPAQPRSSLRDRVMPVGYVEPDNNFRP